MKVNQKIVSVVSKASIASRMLKIMSGLLLAFVMCTATSLWCGNAQEVGESLNRVDLDFFVNRDLGDFLDYILSIKPSFVPMLFPLREDPDYDDMRGPSLNQLFYEDAGAVVEGVLIDGVENVESENLSVARKKRRRSNNSDVPGAKRACIDGSKIFK